MDFFLAQEIREMKDTIREFVDREVDNYAGQIEDEDRIPDCLLNKAKDMGLFGMSIPEEYGGLGLSILDRCLLLEDLGRAPAGFVSFIGAHTGIGSTGIVEMGTEEQKKKYLPSMARGEKLGAFALTEPNAGSDAANLSTRAVRQGDKWILNGLKHFITNGTDADVITVIAVTDREKGPYRGISAFIVEKDFPGFRAGAAERKMGLRGSHSCELIFDNCEVPAQNLLGEEGRGFASALRILAVGRLMLGARCVGACEKLIEMCTRYARQREQFGRPIGSFQAIQWMLADMLTETAAARALTREVAWRADNGERCVKETSMVKLFASEVLGRVSDKAVQVYGGMGYMKDFPAERFYRDARITRIYEGTNEIQRLIIASDLLKESKVPGVREATPD